MSLVVAVTTRHARTDFIGTLDRRFCDFARGLRAVLSGLTAFKEKTAAFAAKVSESKRPAGNAIDLEMKPDTS